MCIVSFTYHSDSNSLEVNARNMPLPYCADIGKTVCSIESGKINIGFDALEYDGIYYDTYRVDAHFMISEIPAGTYEIEFYTPSPIPYGSGSGEQPEHLKVNADLAEGYSCNFNLEFDEPEGLADLKREWLYGSYDGDSYLARLEDTINIDGSEYNRFKYCTLPEWDSESATTIAYMRHDNTDVYVRAVNMDLPSDLWHSSEGNSINPFTMINGESLIYSYSPEPDAIMVVPDFSMHRMESLLPENIYFSSRIVNKKDRFVSTEWADPEVSFNNSDLHWRAGVGLIGNGASGCYAYPSYFSQTSWYRNMRVACVRNYETGKVYYMDHGLMEAIADRHPVYRDLAEIEDLSDGNGIQIVESGDSILRVMASGSLTVTILDMTGIVRINESGTSSLDIDLAGIGTGVYIIHVSSEGGSRTRKIHI